MTRTIERAEIEEMEGMEMGTEETAVAVTDIAPLELTYDKISLTPGVVARYICKGGTKDDIFWFMGTCRALQLDPLKGEVYFVKFPGEPGRPVVGYRKYLAVAYDNGLENIEYEFDDEDDPKKCTITLDIKGRKPFVWATWLEEVIKRKKPKKPGKLGEPNVFWATMLRDMLRKCSVTRALRYAGLETQSLPYIAEETVQAFDSPALQAHHYAELREAETAPEPAAIEEVIEDTGIDLTPLRETYFGMIEGIFANADDRHAWQLLNTEKASVTGWGPAEYSRAFKALAQMVGPRKKEAEEVPEVKSDAKVPKVEEMKSEPDEPVDGMSKEEVEKEVKEQAESARMTEEEAEAFFAEKRKQAQAEIDKKYKEEQAELEEARQNFLDLGALKFATVKERDSFCRKNVNTGPPKEWAIGDYELAIKLMEEMADCGAEDPDVEKPLDTKDLDQEIATFLGDHEGNIRADFISISTTKFPTIVARDNWLMTYVKSPDKSWTNEDYAKGILLLHRLPDFSENGQKAAQGEEEATKRPEPQPGGENGVSDNLAPILTKNTYDMIRAIVLPSEKYASMRSVEFRAKVRDIIGRKYGKLRTIREAEGQRILAELQREQTERYEELAAELDDDPNADKELIPDDLLTGLQYDLIKHHAVMMPDRFNMGSDPFRSFVSSVTKKPYDGIRKLTEEQGDAVIQAQKDFIRAEADKYNGLSKEETATTHAK